MSRLERDKPLVHPYLTRIAALLGRWEGTISNEEGKLLKGDIHTDYRPLQTTLQQTQTRSWAPSGPVRIQCAAELRIRHRGGFKLFVLWYIGNLIKTMQDLTPDRARIDPSTNNH